MATKPWHLNRRTFLRGGGVALGLPFLECMAAQSRPAERTRRFCAIYFPFGIVDRPADSPQAEWNWFPREAGQSYQFNKSMLPLESVREDLTILGGLSHPKGRKMGGHDTGDTWLTAAELKAGHLDNTISLDQLIAEKFGDQTRFPSLTLSIDGGVAEPTRATTLSYSRTGQPIPSENKPRIVFDQLFGVNDDSLEAQRKKLQGSASMLDLVLEHSRWLSRQLGKHDQRKLDEYMTSVRHVEQRVARAEQWLDVPKPEVDASGLRLDADDNTPRELVRTMCDLIVLAFQTDSTRAVTYQLGAMNGATSLAGKFPLLLGLSDNMHLLAHNARKSDEGAKPAGEWDFFLNEQLAYLIDRLRSTPEGDSTLLDSTFVLYGSSNSQTHVNTNYPLILAGGKGLGAKHGSYLRFPESVPLSNLFVTLLDRLGVGQEAFVDSTGELTEVLA